MITRAGIGYDIHQFKEGRELWLGGVHIPFDKGLLGHSDADVLLHAIADALLGAAGLGDIGQHFPDTSPEWKDVKSTVMLRKVHELLTLHSFVVVNVDATVILEEPKISPFIDEMKNQISTVLKILPQQVNIKATTNEQLGFLGSGEGAAALAIASIQFR